MRFLPSDGNYKESSRAYLERLLSASKTIEIKSVSRKRSLPQNALFHVWIRVIADSCGYESFDSCKRDVKDRILGKRLRENLIDGTFVEDEYHTSEMTQEELRDFMEKLKIWASTYLNLYLPYYGDPGYEEMLQQFG